MRSQFLFFSKRLSILSKQIALLEARKNTSEMEKLHYSLVTEYAVLHALFTAVACLDVLQKFRYFSTKEISSKSNNQTIKRLRVTYCLANVKTQCSFFIFI